MAHKSWIIQYSDKVVEKDIPNLGKPAKTRIKKEIESKLTVDPIHFGKPLRYSLYRLRSLRVGDYRVLYQTYNAQSKVLIVAIGHRKSIYDML